jgi:hypothetical protein
VPGILFYLALACCGFALAGVRRGALARTRALPSRRHRCRARPLFSETGHGSFVIDAVVEACDDPAIPLGVPFAMRLVPPKRPRNWVYSQLRVLVDRGTPLSVELEESTTGWRARLCTNGWLVVLDLEHTSGWPSSLYRDAA